MIDQSDQEFMQQQWTST